MRTHLFRSSKCKHSCAAGAVGRWSHARVGRVNPALLLSPRIAVQPIRPMGDNSTAHHGPPPRPLATRQSPHHPCPFPPPGLAGPKYLPACVNTPKGLNRFLPQPPSAHDADGAPVDKMSFSFGNSFERQMVYNGAARTGGISASFVQAEVPLSPHFSSGASAAAARKPSAGVFSYFKCRLTKQMQCWRRSRRANRWFPTATTHCVLR